MDIGSIKSSLNPLPVQGVVRPASVDQATQAQALVVEDKTAAEERANAASADKEQGVSRKQVEDAVSTIQEFVQSVRRSINFSLDDGSGRVLVKVTDADSGDVIRQIPSEEALQLAESLEGVRSLLFKAEA